MKLSVIAPVLNECPWIGYSIMSVLPYVHSFHYGIDNKSDDGTFELVKMLSETAGKDKVFWYKDPVFSIDPMNMEQYDGAFNALIAAAIARGAEAVWFLHPDMICTNPEIIPTLVDDPLAWFTHMTSYAKDFSTVISKGRSDKWKNIHSARFGLHYFGAYGSQNEDFYHKEITGNSHKHYGTEFSKYPFQVADSGLKINHYCEAKDYRRRLGKMKLCLKTLFPGSSEDRIEEMAVQHPRVSLESSSSIFGEFAFTESKEPVPAVFEKYKSTFEQFIKTKETVNA